MIRVEIQLVGQSFVKNIIWKIQSLLILLYVMEILLEQWWESN